MSNYHNVRNSSGQFTRKVKRASNGKFASPIVAGRLYEFRGATVRAMKDVVGGRRSVSFHKTLFGFVPQNQLKKISGSKVEKYLEAA